MKKVFFLLLSCILIGCSKTPIKKSSLLSYIPKDAQVIIKINDLEKTKNELRNNSFIQNNLDLSFFKYFKKLPNNENTSQVSESLLCFSPVGKSSFEYTYISKFNPNKIVTDSIKLQDVESFTYDKTKILKIKDGSKFFYSTQIDSMLFASSSKLLVENAIRQKKSITPVSADLKKAYKISSDDTGSSILINGKELSSIHDALIPKGTSTSLSNFSGWISLDTKVDQDELKIDGIAIEKDSLSSTIGLFNDLSAQENRVAEITPITAEGFVSFTYDDYGILKRNLAIAQDRNLKDIPNSIDDLLNASFEISQIYLPKGQAVAFSMYDPDAGFDNFSKEKVSTYRNIDIYANDDEAVFDKVLNPLIQDFEASYYFLHEEFLVFASRREILKTIIANIQNKSTLGSQSVYTEIAEKLANKSSISIVGNHNYIKEYVTKGVHRKYKKEWADVNQKGYQIAALQIIKEENYAHIHGILKKNEKQSITSTVNQVATTTLEAPLVTRPVLVKNHRSKGLDIAVQDVNNNLYLISEKGSIFWKKQIDGAIMGDIQQIDIYSNGRYQLLFNTEHTLYLVDRDGKDVYPFPKRFSKPITQPLSLFDYDKKKNYRIAITQGKKVTMYNTRTQVVTGFKFKGASSKIINSPQHIRIDTKDYILVQEENGRLHILNRLGRQRIKVNQKFKFSDNIWYKYQDGFASTTADGQFIQIKTDGEISRKNTKLGSKNGISTTNRTKVTFSENMLYIKDKPIELEYGVYTKPKIFLIKNKIYVTLTDLQTNRVFLYDSNGIILHSFPIYGNSLMSLGNMDDDDQLEFAVQGEEDSVLIYQIN